MFPSQQGMIMETLTAVKEAVESWMTEIFSEISEDGRSKDIVFPTAELKTLIGELTRELTAIHRDLMEDGLTPILREIPSFTYINKGLKHMARLSAYVAKRVLDARDMMISTCFETAKGFSAVVFRGKDISLILKHVLHIFVKWISSQIFYIIAIRY